MDRFECRKALVESLEKDGFLERTEDYPHSVGHCYRCNTMVEPNLSLQWFVRAKPLADKAIEAVETGNTRIIPENWKKTYYDWMYNIRDWCISRQIWWGHQIPAWTCDHCREMVVEMEAPETCPSCGKNELTQEEDVLDTWFSSALWPFSTMGWPEETPLLKTFYPTSSLVTAFDILFFWVARMMMFGIHFMGDVPFEDVYIHALVRDEDGQKMSKSKGNIIDPLTVIDNYGTDAFRFTLAAFAAMGRDVKMSEKRVEGYRHFINKIWNAVRFSLMHLKSGCDRLPDGELSLIDRWILSRLKTCTEETTNAMEEYRFNEAAGTLYRFVWHEFCDWYLEGIKPVLYGEDDKQKDSTRKVLWRVLNDTTVLLHPFVPFITEEIWHKMPDTSGSVMRAVYPKDREDADRVKYDPVAESRMQTVMDVITGIRNIRGEMNILPSLELVAYVRSEEKEVLEVLDRHRGIVENLARLKSLSAVKDVERPKSSATAVLGNAILYIPLEGIINFEKESRRLQKELNKLEDEIAAMSKKLNNEDFLNKAPEEVVEKVKEKHRVLADKYANVESNLSRIKKIVSI
jgi:valyl-tRNA synthetase